MWENYVKSSKFPIYDNSASSYTAVGRYVVIDSNKRQVYFSILWARVYERKWFKMDFC